jgi:hypothetical protein
MYKKMFNAELDHFGPWVSIHWLAFSQLVPNNATIYCKPQRLKNARVTKMKKEKKI